MRDYAIPCSDCTLEFDGAGDGPKAYVYFCATHKHASEMLAALRAARESIYNFVPGRRAWGCLSPFVKTRGKCGTCSLCLIEALIDKEDMTPLTAGEGVNVPPLVAGEITVGQRRRVC